MAKKSKATHNKGQLITTANPKSPISEQYRTIRTSLEFKMVDQGINTFLVTSAEANAGKSTTISNLAVTFAQRGKKVLLIDADLRKPFIHNCFKASNHVGLTNLLAQQLAFNEVAKGTLMAENLTLITSGPIPPNPSELLGSMSMQRFIESARSVFDIVLIDTPPVVAVTDAVILSSQVDGVVMVARAHQTKKEGLIKAKKLFEQVQANVLGVILHGGSAGDSAYYYYGDT
ncbi:CpsD/CapB family tyrosine-protein kinase [Lactovum odontotermitis]